MQNTRTHVIFSIYLLTVLLRTEFSDKTGRVKMEIRSYYRI